MKTIAITFTISSLILGLTFFAFQRMAEQEQESKLGHARLAQMAQTDDMATDNNAAYVYHNVSFK